MAETRVMPCKCLGVTEIKVKHPVRAPAKLIWTNIPFSTQSKGAEFQDMLYGKGMRLHNVSGNPKKQGEANCTVCGARKLP